MKKIKNAVIVYAEAIRWINSPNYKGTSSKDKPVLLVDEEGYEIFCKPEQVGRNSVKLSYWYKIERVPSNEKYNFRFEVLRIVPGFGLSPDEWKKKNLDKKLKAREVEEKKDWSDEILEILKNEFVLQHKDIHSRLTKNMKHHSDYTEDEKRTYTLTDTAMKKLHSEGKVYCVKIYRQEQDRASEVFYGIDPNALLELFEGRQKPKLVDVKTEERNQLWGKLHG